MDAPFVGLIFRCLIITSCLYVLQACLDRRTGQIDGIYYDPKTSPLQKLQLKPSRSPECGYSFGTVSIS